MPNTRQDQQPADQPKPSPEYTAFDNALGRALSIPKSEIDRREDEWQKKQAPKKRKKAV